MMGPPQSFDAITVTLNPAIDRTLIVPEFMTGSVNRVHRWTDAPGGKGVNVAVALSDHGHRIAATGFLGVDNASAFDRLFAEKQIHDRFVRISGSTRIGIKVVDPTRGETTDINFSGLSPRETDLTALDERIAQLQARWFILAGSLPPGVRANYYEGLVTALKSRGARVALDTSGEALARGVRAAPNLMKPNLSELAVLVGRPLGTKPEIVEAARRLVDGGVEMVVVSMGAQGACFADHDGAWWAEPPGISSGSTVGAGDAMVAGIVSAQLEGLPIVECARRSTAFALRILTGRDFPSANAQPANEAPPGPGIKVVPWRADGRVPERP